MNNSANDISLGSSPNELGDLLIGYLDQLEVDYLFGVPGGAIEPLYNALARSERRDGIRSVVARHESGAAFMADGYARETGKLGVCCSTTGPGATNLITGVASALADNVPMLVITAQTALPHFGKGAFQESSCTAVDTVAMFRHCTVYSTLVSHPEQLEPKLLSAITNAFQEQGPAHISIPRDILSSPWPTAVPGSDLHNLIKRPELVDSSALERLCDCLKRGRKNVLLVGGGCNEAIHNIIIFAELTGAILLSTPQGKALLDTHHPQYRGVFGFAGHASARDTMLDEEVDWIVAIGTNLDEFGTSGWDQDALLNKKLIHIDNQTDHFSRSSMAHLHVYGNIQTIFTTLIERAIVALHEGHPCIDLKERTGDRRNPEQERGERRGQGRESCVPRQIQLNAPDKYRSDESPIKPQRLICELTRRLPDETRYLADTGNSFAWTTHYLHPHQQNVYRVAMSFGAMGWAIGAAVGTAFGAPGKPVVCITGDGSYLMSGQELTVAVEAQLCVLFVVLNDQSLGMIKHGQQMAGAESIGHALPPIDYAAVARAMGARGLSITSVEELQAIDFGALCKAGGPTLLDVHIDAEEVSPMGMRIRTLNEANQVSGSPFSR